MTIAAEPDRAHAESVARSLPHRVVVLGNPNVGKTTIFNALGRTSARVGNYAGVTVECTVGTLRPTTTARHIELVDVPGAYSLSARSAEEQIAISAALGLGDHGSPTSRSSSSTPGSSSAICISWCSSSSSKCRASSV